MQNLIRSGYIGNPNQLAMLRRVVIAEGRAKGAEVIEIRTAGGLELDVLPDTGLDIGQVRYNGLNMSWMSKNGYDSPAIISHSENDFVNTFPGGMLYTCGLRSVGPANRDSGEWHPTHGRFHSLPAEQVCAERTDTEILVSGAIRETALFGHCLEVKRTIRVPIFGSSVTVEDAVTNQSPADEEYMMIYHCNFGYPLLSETAFLTLPEDRVTIPRTEFAKAGLAKELQFDKPIPGEEERVFFQLMEHTYRAKLTNHAVKTCAEISWSGDTLPILGHWRSMASGDYVLGLEPTNCYLMGRNKERENGTLPVLKAWESVRHTVQIEFAEAE